MDTGEALAMGEDGSIILAGHTNGDWDRKRTKSSDFAAMKLSADGKEIWRWQVGCGRCARVCHAPLGGSLHPHPVERHARGAKISTLLDLRDL